ncbi:MTH938/NDUFAF3 family protein [Chloroflexota bacterium]
MTKKVERFSFGTIVVDGKKCHHDIIICADGTVKRRKGGVWRFGSHSVKKEEIEELRGAEIAVIGMGTRSKVHLSDSARDYAQETNLQLLLLTPHEAVNRLNQLLEEGKRASSLFHITC